MSNATDQWWRSAVIHQVAITTVRPANTTRGPHSAEASPFTGESHRFGAYGVLAGVFPPKIVLAAYARENRFGRTDYGVAAHLPWLTDAGRSLLAVLDDTREYETRG